MTNLAPAPRIWLATDNVFTSPTARCLSCHAAQPAGHVWVCRSRLTSGKGCWRRGLFVALPGPSVATYPCSRTAGICPLRNLPKKSHRIKSIGCKGMALREEAEYEKIMKKRAAAVWTAETAHPVARMGACYIRRCVEEGDAGQHVACILDCVDKYQFTRIRFGILAADRESAPLTAITSDFLFTLFEVGPRLAFGREHYIGFNSTKRLLCWSPPGHGPAPSAGVSQKLRPGVRGLYVVLLEETHLKTNPASITDLNQRQLPARLASDYKFVPVSFAYVYALVDHVILVFLFRSLQRLGELHAYPLSTRATAATALDRRHATHRSSHHRVGSDVEISPIFWLL